MITHKKLLLLPLILTLFTINSFAENINSDISFQPTALTINATRGESVYRNLFITTSQETPIRKIKLFAIDLSSESNKNILTQKHITVLEKSSELTVYTPITLPIEINVSGIKSGHYQGSIRLQYDTGYKNVPINLNIKDDYYFPLFILLLGVSIAFGLTYYKKYGKSQDELSIQIFKLTQKIKEKKFYEETGSLAIAFQTKINNFLIDTDEAFSNNDWKSARETLNNANLIWIKWIKGVKIWRELQKLIDTQYASIETLKPEGASTYLNSIKHKIAISIKNCPDDTTTDVLRDILYNMSLQILKYQKLQENPTNKELLESLDSLTIDDKEKIQALEKKINTKTNSSTRTITVDSEQKDESSKSNHAKKSSMFNINSIDFDDIVHAHNNLFILKLITIALTIITIAGTGFNQFYLEKLTFGANMWSDYFNLFIWGFGSEATRTILVGTVKEADVPAKVKKES